MKRNILSTFYFKLSTIICVIVIMMVGCEPDHSDKLDGKWQLREVVNVDGTVNIVDTVWYNFQNTLFMYQLYEKTDNTYRHIYGFKTWEDKENVLLEMESDPVSVESFLPYTDWESSSLTFRVEECSGSRLVLSSEGKKYRFNKF